ARRAAGARDLAELLLGQGVEARLGDDAEIASERYFEPDAEAIPAAGGNDRFRTAGRNCDVPGELRDMLGRRLHESLDVSARREMLAGGAQYDHAHTGINLERLKDETELIALFHGDDIERRPVEHDIRALPLSVDLNTEAIELIERREQV